MSIGLIAAGTSPAGQSAPAPASSHAKAGSPKTESSPGNAAEETPQGSDTKTRSFGDLLNRRDADPSARHDTRPDTEFAPQRGAKEHAPWRPFDLMKPQRPDDRGERATVADEYGEIEAGEEIPIAVALPIQATVTAKEGSKTVPADPRQELPPAAFGLARSEGAPGGAKEPPRRQGTVTAPENRIAPPPAARSELRAEAGPSAGEAKAAWRGEPFLADQARAMRAAPVASTAAAADRGEAKITVISSQVSPAPAPVSASGLSLTGAAFVDTLKSEGALPQHLAAARELPEGLQASSSRPVTTLKLQLHPAELGSVTVKLTGSGEQLAIEVQVENSEARHRLSTDSEAIVKALRGMGFDIDRITVQQAPSSSSTPGGGTNRENGFSAQEGRSGERQDQSARQESEQRHDQDSRGNSVDIGDRGEASGGGVYI